MTVDFSNPRLGRLTPLAAILARIDAGVGAVAPKTVAVAAARGSTLAESVVGAALPTRAIAMRDGFAVDSAAIADAGPYVPVPLPAPARRIDVGEQLPDGTDAVLPFDAVTERGEHAEAVAAIVPGDGVLAAGGDMAAGAPLRRSGQRVRAIDVSVMSAAAIQQISVRAPKIHVVRGGDARSPVIDAALVTIARVAAEAGGAVAGKSVTIETALRDPEIDLVIALGGTGSGQRDSAVATLARHGRVEAHGIAASPGESAALGFVGSRPVLLMPGRLDAALSIWLLIGRHLVAKLAGGCVDDAPTMLRLKRKLASAIGLAELMPVRCSDGMAEPLASGYLSFASLARSDGWLVIAAESEGFAAGALVAVRPWP
jgi:molybdopterin molybdotransferase